MSRRINIWPKIIGALIVAVVITLIIPKTHGAIDLPVHDTYFVINPWIFALGIWILLTFIVLAANLIFRRIS